MSRMEQPLFVKESLKRFRQIMASKEKNGFDKMIREHKGELFALHYLAQKDGDVFPSELSTALKSSPARISALLKSLEKKGKIKRHVDAENRRNIRVCITEKGRQHSVTQMKKLGDRLSLVFMDMGEENTRNYLHLLELFFTHSQKHFHDFDEDEGR